MDAPELYQEVEKVIYLNRACVGHVTKLHQLLYMNKIKFIVSLGFHMNLISL